jgi:Pilus formation protein N terminal region
MRYLSFLAAVLASAPACAAEYTHTIELPPGFVQRWQAPRPFKNVILGNPNIVDAVPSETNQELIITAKPGGGNTNIVLVDENGKQVANVRVTNPAPQYQPARSAENGKWDAKTGTFIGKLQLYRNDDKCYLDLGCVRRPNDRGPTKRGDTAQSNAPQPNGQASEN